MSDRRPTFTDLYLAVRDTSRSEEKVALLAEYLACVPNDEFGWAVYLLQGGNHRGGVKSRELREWAADVAHVPGWLVEESYSVAGDLAETVSLLASRAASPDTAQPREQSLAKWIHDIDTINSASVAERRGLVVSLWASMSQPEILVFTKLLTGGLRIGVAKGAVAKALAKLLEVPYAEVWQRLAGQRAPEQLTREVLSAPIHSQQSVAPYPFFLAYPLEPDTLEVLPYDEWQCEWKWDGIRAQVVKRASTVAIWSRGDELISDAFPELCEDAVDLPDGTVLDGEIVAWSAEDHPASFFDLQKRINRTKVSAALRAAVPVRFLAYDLLEYNGRDIRESELAERRALLTSLCETVQSKLQRVVLPEILSCASWSEVQEKQRDARSYHAEGLMLKRRDSRYGVGRTARGSWWKWKVAPLSVDAVLLYAQKGHGRRADLYTDYTFGVWDGDTLVTFTKAYSGLTDAEIAQVDAFVKRNTKERFGPVRTVTPELVFEIAFEAIQASKRHRSGVAVRFPRIVRWRRDKPAKEADTLESLRRLASME